MLVSGTGFPPGAALEVLLFSDPVRLGTTTADANRNFRLVVTIPLDTAPGLHTLRVGEIGTGLAAETTLQVLARPVVATVRPTTGTLSRTGGDMAGAVRVALGLLLGGLLFVRLGRRGRSSWPPDRRGLL